MSHSPTQVNSLSTDTSPALGGHDNNVKMSIADTFSSFMAQQHSALIEALVNGNNNSTEEILRSVDYRNAAWAAIMPCKFIEDLPATTYPQIINWLVNNGFPTSPATLPFIKNMSYPLNARLQLATELFHKTDMHEHRLPVPCDWYGEGFCRMEWCYWLGWSLGYPELSGTSAPLIMSKSIMLNPSIPISTFLHMPAIFPLRNCSWLWLENNEISSDVKLAAIKSAPLDVLINNPRCLYSAFFGCETDVARYLISVGCNLKFLGIWEFNIHLHMLVKALISRNTVVGTHMDKSVFAHIRALDLLLTMYSDECEKYKSTFADIKFYANKLTQVYTTVAVPWLNRKIKIDTPHKEYPLLL